MTAHRFRRTALLAAAATVLTLLGSGCGPGWTDDGTDIVSLLKIEIPKSATHIVGHTDSGVDFLMPNDEWHGYVAKYYPDKTMSQFPTKENDGTLPLECVPAYRSGVGHVVWVTGDEIQYRKTDRHMRRSVSVTPDCEAGKALVQWRLRDLK